MKISVVSGPNQGTVFELVPGNNFIGRAQENSIELPSGQVSRRHTCVSLVDERVFVEDLGSSNGTFLAGKQLTGKAEVLPGMPIQIGEFVLQLGEPGAPLMGAVPGTAGRPGSPQMVHIGMSPGRNLETPFWKFYRVIGFLGWRGQLIVLMLLTSLALVGIAVAIPLAQSQADLETEVLLRAEVLLKNLAMRNGEFIKTRQETNLDTASFQVGGVVGAYLLSKELTILSPVEQRGKSKMNAVSRKALTSGLVTMRESEITPEGDPGTYHLAMPIKVWTNEAGTYDTYGVAYLVFQAKEVAARTFGLESKFISSSIAIAVIMILFLMAVFLLTGRPMMAVKEDAELVLRGDLSNVESRARWKELTELTRSLNRSFERYGEVLAQVASLDAQVHEGAVGTAGPVQGGVETSGDAKVAAIANAVQEGVVITDDMQRVVYMNRLAERQFGIPLGRVKNRHIMEVISNQELLGGILDLFKQLLNTDQDTVTGSVSLSEGGRNRSINLVLAGVMNSGRQLEYAAIILR